MADQVWKHRVDAALARLQRDQLTVPAARYMEVIDEVAAGRGTAADIARRAGSPELVAGALDRLTAAMHGDGATPALGQGGWYERDGERYRVAPAFAQEWRAARDAQRRMQARRAV